jgi:UPF0716 family protein affecting phage T7 exclusion
MHAVLWVLQIILGIKLLSVSYSHGLRQTQPTMQDAMQKMGKPARSLHHVIAICTAAGAIGLILPGILGLSTRIISATAIFLTIVLLSSIFFHVRSRERPNIFVSVILLAFAVVIAYGRWEFIS